MAKFKITRRQEGISLNPAENLLDEDGEMLIFDTETDALFFLNNEGFIAETVSELWDSYFISVEEYDPREGELPGYPVFVMLMLCIEAGVIDGAEPYDSQWQDATLVYRGFKNGLFDDKKKSEYDCIYDFIHYYTHSNNLDHLLSRG